MNKADRHTPCGTYEHSKFGVTEETGGSELLFVSETLFSMTQEVAGATSLA